MQQPAPPRWKEPAIRRTWAFHLTSFIFVVLQKARALAVIAISGVRVAIGLSSLADANVWHSRSRRIGFIAKCDSHSVMIAPFDFP